MRVWELVVCRCGTVRIIKDWPWHEMILYIHFPPLALIGFDYLQFRIGRFLATVNTPCWCSFFLIPVAAAPRAWLPIERDSTTTFVKLRAADVLQSNRWWRAVWHCRYLLTSKPPSEWKQSHSNGNRLWGDNCPSSMGIYREVYRWFVVCKFCTARRFSGY